jgi:hypothetical protein
MMLKGSLESKGIYIYIDDAIGYKKLIDNCQLRNYHTHTHIYNHPMFVYVCALWLFD